MMTGQADQARARAHSNIALVKYWGKREGPLNLPAVGSLSVTLDALYTETTVRLCADRSADRLILDGKAHEGTPESPELARVSAFLDLVRERAGSPLHVEVVTANNFPTGAGLASSASAFAALAIAATRAMGLGCSSRELSRLARRGSGSAARSIFGGFVEMHRGVRDDGEDAYAEPIAAAADWPLQILVAITDSGPKATGSTRAMLDSARTSPYFDAWVEAAAADLRAARAAVAGRDFSTLAAVCEHSCLKMHAVMQSARPGIVYWNPSTVAAIHAVRALRESGVPVFFTVDAGPQVKAVCEPEAVATVARTLESTAGVERVLRSGLGPDAHLLEA